MSGRSLRVRLAFWYFATVTVICGLAAVGYWWSVRSALDSALDQGLRYRLIGLRGFLDAPGEGRRETVAARLAGVSSLGEQFEVFDAQGRLVAQSQGLARHRVSLQPPRDLGHGIRYETAGPPDFRVRVAWQAVTVAGESFVIGVADPQRKFEGVLGAFTSVLRLSMPVIALVAIAGGVWLGRRALAPVARIADEARAIGEGNLSARLAVPDSHDELQQLSETLNDMLARLERSFTRTRQFTADASHELRAPMTLICTAAQHSLRRERTREELVEAMRKILAEAQRTSGIVDDLLQLARGDAGRGPAALVPLDAAPLVRDAAGQARSIALGRAISVDLQLPVGALPIVGNDAQVRRLLLILVDNAVKYTPEGGRVTMVGGADAGAVVISVADTGCGIAADDLPHVFERFWRADKVRSREAGGTGLGLTIAKQIAEAHGGRLDAQSEVGRGSVFTVHLPLTLEPLP
jgi:heavy metal sensor kinase